MCSHYCIVCGRKHPHQLGFILDCKFADFSIDWFNVNRVCNTMQSTNKIESIYKVYLWLFQDFFQHLIYKKEDMFIFLQYVVIVAIEFCYLSY